MDWIYAPSDPLWETLAGTVLLFIALVVITRIIGLRSFAKFNTVDFASTIAIGSIISSTLTSSTSIAQGTVAIIGLLVITIIVSYLQKYSELVDNLVTNEPLLLMDGAEILEENLAAASISREQLIAKLREANVLNFGQVKAVIFETTGDISVLHTSEDESVELDDIMLTGVRMKP